MKYFFWILFITIIFSSCNFVPQYNFINTEISEYTQTITIKTSPEPISTIQPISTPTPPIPYIINPELPKIGLEDFLNNYDEILQDYTTVSLSDLRSGKLIKFEENYLSGNPVFDDHVLSSEIVISSIKYSFNYGTYKSDLVNLKGSGMDSHLIPETRPLKIISFYVFRDDRLFSDLKINPIRNDGSWYDEKWPFWLVTWVYYNPDGSTSLGHSLIEIFDYVNLVNNLNNFPSYPNLPYLAYKPAPEFNYYDINIDDLNINKINSLVVHQIYENYPDLKPDNEEIKDWVSSKSMPKDLQTKLFGLATSIQQLYWNSDYFFWRPYPD